MLNKFIFGTFILLFASMQSKCQDTVLITDIMYKKFDSGIKVFRKNTNNPFTGYAADYSDGKPLLVIYYYEGVLKESKDYFKNGALKRKTYYKEQGKEEGEFKEWDENNKIKIEGQFENGMKSGIWKYYKDGIIESLGAFNSDLKAGIWKYYDKDGNFVKKEFYFNGVLK